MSETKEKPCHRSKLLIDPPWPFTRVFQNRATCNEHSVCNMVSAITTLAMLNSDVLHINVRYDADLNEFAVRVFDADAIFCTHYRQNFGQSVQLETPAALNKLKALEDKLIELVALAKDKLMGAV